MCLFIHLYVSYQIPIFLLSTKLLIFLMYFLNNMRELSEAIISLRYTIDNNYHLTSAIQ